MTDQARIRSRSLACLRHRAHKALSPAQRQHTICDGPPDVATHADGRRLHLGMVAMPALACRSRLVILSPIIKFSISRRTEATGSKIEKIRLQPDLTACAPFTKHSCLPRGSSESYTRIFSVGCTSEHCADAGCRCRAPNRVTLFVFNDRRRQT